MEKKLWDSIDSSILKSLPNAARDMNNVSISQNLRSWEVLINQTLVMLLFGSMAKTRPLN